MKPGAANVVLADDVQPQPAWGRLACRWPDLLYCDLPHIVRRGFGCTTAEEGGTLLKPNNATRK